MMDDVEEELVSSCDGVLICGGGPSGLLAAILLSDMGIASTVIEESKDIDQWNSKSYSLILNPKGIAALDRASCLQAIMDVGIKRKFIHFVNGTTGHTLQTKDTTNIALSRPLLVECLENVIIRNELLSQNITIRRGWKVSGVTKNTTSTNKNNCRLQVHLLKTTNDNDNNITTSTINASHVIGADGKWSKVRQSFSKEEFRSKIITCPSFGVSLFAPTVPDSWSNTNTYIVKPSKGCMFYVVVSPLPTGGMSLSMVCFDKTITKYPWLKPPPPSSTSNMEQRNFAVVAKEEGWNEEEEEECSSTEKKTFSTETTNLLLSDHIKDLFQDVMPSFYNILDKSTYSSARIKRRVSWLKMSSSNYTTQDGLVTLIGDAAHAMTPSMGEGGNCALESAMKLADAIRQEQTLPTNNNNNNISAILSEAFLKYGESRPKEVQPIQELSAARNNM